MTGMWSLLCNDRKTIHGYPKPNCGVQLNDFTIRLEIFRYPGRSNLRLYTRKVHWLQDLRRKDMRQITMITYLPKDRHGLICPK
jgi:hypothetical protein